MHYIKERYESRGEQSFRIERFQFNKYHDSNLTRLFDVNKKYLTKYELNATISPEFGQKWNIPDIPTKILISLGATFFHQTRVDYNDLIYTNIRVLINELYASLHNHNKELSIFDNKYLDHEDKINIICGIVSGLKLRDIEYFTFELHGDGMNQTKNNADLSEKAKETGRGMWLHFVLSPETAQEIISSRNQ